MKQFLRKIDKTIRNKIRVIIWKQWKTFWTRYNNLLKLGATKQNAWRTAGCRKGYQYVCHTATIQATITNEKLKISGLTQALILYSEIH